MPARAYATIFVVVAFSVIVQAGCVPAVAGWLGIPRQILAPRPWGMNARFEEEPDSMHRFVVAVGSAADGVMVAELRSDDLWVSLIVSDGRMVTVTPDIVLCPGDEVLVLAEPDAVAAVSMIFTRSGADPPAHRPRPSPRTVRQRWLRGITFRPWR